MVGQVHPAQPSSRLSSQPSESVRGHRTRCARSIWSVLGLVLVASGCSYISPEKDSPQIKPGVCVTSETQDQGDLVPELSTIVDCDKPHIYEIYDIIQLPESALAGSTRQELIDNRDDLALPSELTDDSEERQAFEAFAERECVTSLQRVTGYDELTLGKASAEDARIVPALRGVNAPWFTVMPEKEWLEGRREVVCSARFEEPEHTESGRTPAKAQTSSDARMLVTRISDNKLPVEFRQCRAYDEARREVSAAPCAEPHVDEALFYFEADGVFDTKFITSIVKQPTPKKFDRLDKVCTDALPQILGREFDPKAMRGFGSVARRWTQENKTVRCSVGRVDFRKTDLPPGSLVASG